MKSVSPDLAAGTPPPPGAPPDARVVAPEWLDSLDPSDPRAIHSRADLRKLNWLMGHAGAIARGLEPWSRAAGPARLVEMGCGDGRLLLRALRKLPKPPEDSAICLVDKEPVVSRATIDGYAQAGWRANVFRGPVVEFLASGAMEGAGCAISNLFLHHFEDREIRLFFETVVRSASGMVMLEPRRSPFALVAARLCGLIGCNEVTRHDAGISVRAGFAGAELSRLWPERQGWELSEGPFGLFSHRFLARRVKGRP